MIRNNAHILWSPQTNAPTQHPARRRDAVLVMVKAEGRRAMILHICGNLAAGKTTTAERVQEALGWPCVPVGRIRNALQDEIETWAAVRKLWAAWDTADGQPGRSGIWLSTGFNWRELDALQCHPPHYLRRIWLTAPPAVLRERLRARGAAPTGYWPFNDTADTLQESLCCYDAREEPLPWPTDSILDTSVIPVEQVVAAVVALAHQPWMVAP